MAMTVPMSPVVQTLKTARSSNVAVMAPTMLIPFACPHEASGRVDGATGRVKRLRAEAGRTRPPSRSGGAPRAAAEFGDGPERARAGPAATSRRTARYYEALGVPCGGGA